MTALIEDLSSSADDVRANLRPMETLWESVHGVSNWGKTFPHAVSLRQSSLLYNDELMRRRMRMDECESCKYC